MYYLKYDGTFLEQEQPIDNSNYEYVELDYFSYQSLSQDLSQQEAAKAFASIQIAKLKQLLAETDYQAIKFAEGRITAQDYATISNQRQEWRDRINELESELL